ncbi:hypothetical protein CEP54_014477 [Fusarium duplospermum]|uniref:F-box domain-containing protein n=1 Tax=Fusarium duplospermum TaxID=1325734 RepID=A0A428NW51_9HYPO|nr:hypothetical protein CEP54_014477 [Fusarium duplospermum]
MSILKSPREVQLAILELLPLSDLIALSTTSKDARHKVEPLIYSDIRIIRELHGRPPIMLLLRTILDRPELGSYVRRLDLGGEEFGVPPSRSFRPRPPVPQMVPLPTERLSQVARNYSSSLELINSWIHEAESGSSDALAAFLIGLLPNLAWLYSSYDWTVEIKYVGLVFRSAVRGISGDSFPPRLPTYESLRRVELKLPSGFDESEYMDIGYIDPVNTLDALTLFYLPNIEHISVCIDNPIEFSWPLPTPPNSTLSSLELGRLREIRLEPLLSTLANLRKLRYDWFYCHPVDRQVSGPIVRLDTMAAALATLSDTLTELEITAETPCALSWGDDFPPTFTLQGSLSQISQLRKLRRLHLPWVFVMGMPASPNGRIDLNIPPDVEDLAFTADLFEADANDWEDDMIISIIKSELEDGVLSVLGSLKKITLPGSMILGREAIEYAGDLEALGAQFNIEVVDQWQDFLERERRVSGSEASSDGSDEIF